MTEHRDQEPLEVTCATSETAGESGGESARDPAVTTGARRAAGRYVSLASLGGRPGEHLQAFVTAAILWAEAERLERACFSAAEDALTGPKARWFDAYYAYQEAKEAEDAARAAMLIVARNVAADAATTRPTQED